MAAAALAGEEWPCARGDPANTGVTANHGPVKEPAVAWKEEEQDLISPGVALGSGLVAYGVGELTISVRDASTGRHVSELHTKQQIVAWPVIRGDSLYVGSPDRVHYILNVANAKERGATEAEAAIVADPVITDDYYLAGSMDGVFYVMSPKNGAVLWRPKTGPVRFGCALDRTTAYVVNEDGVLHALDLRRKREEWTCETKGAPRCAPILAKGGILVVLGDAVQEVSKKGGPGGRWETKGIGAAPVVDGSLLIYGTKGGEIVTLDLGSGKELRRFKVADEGVETAPVVARGILYGTAGKTLFAADPKTGKVLWTFAGEERFQPLIVADKAVYVAAGKTFYCLR
jgi:outer membrane protein assembly factor BamB